MDTENDFPQEKCLCSLTKPEITKQGTFELTDIKYCRMKDEIASMECIDYHTSIVRNVINEYIIEAFATIWLH